MCGRRTSCAMGRAVSAGHPGVGETTVTPTRLGGAAPVDVQSFMHNYPGDMGRCAGEYGFSCYPCSRALCDLGNDIFLARWTPFCASRHVVSGGGVHPRPGSSAAGNINQLIPAIAALR